MPSSAPRLDSRLVAATGRIDKSTSSIAETARQVAALAEHLGLPRPSYETIRRVAHQIRAKRRNPGMGEVLLDIDLRRRPPRAIVGALVGTAPPLPK
jgi:hypothetical protein